MDNNNMTERERQAWEGIKTSVMDFEEAGNWREIGDEAAELRNISFTMS